MSDPLRARRKWLQNNIRKLADEADEPLKTKPEERQQTTEGYPRCELEEKISKATTDNEDLKNDNKQLKAPLDAQARSALRRQIAINIEWEVKMDFLQLASEDKTASMKYGYGPLKGQFKEREVTNLPLRKAIEWAQQSAEEKDLNHLMETWFGPPENGKSEMFKDTMESLKQFSVDAHPTVYKGIPVDAEMARELVRDIKEEFLVDVAVEYVGKLEVRRNQLGQTQRST
ncbi:hypothetical protein HDU86_006966 [Geranomyces michiganensis]|nr:hypothetical protein HDU86_006966 [Geranomyces michiganensis]